jgi:hypothetical protein
MAQERDARNWIVKTFEPATIGENTLVAGVDGMKNLLKYLIVMCDSATTIHLVNSDGVKLTSNFYFPHTGAIYALDQLNILFGNNQSIHLHSTAAANISVMIDVQKVSN